jgi:hypothetical protein
MKTLTAITAKSEQFTKFMSFLFSGMSPRFQRPEFGEGWEGPAPKGFRGAVIMTNATSNRFFVAVEAYKASAVSADRVWQGHQGFVASAPIGQPITWTTRQGKKMTATENGISEIVAATI